MFIKIINTGKYVILYFGTDIVRVPPFEYANFKRDFDHLLTC